MDIYEKAGLPLALVSWRGSVETPEAEPAAVEASRLFELQRSPVFRYLLSFGLPSHECEEIVQEVFLSLFLHLRAGKPRQNLAGWIFRVAHNLGLKRRIRLGSGLVVPFAPNLADQHLDPAPNAEQQMVAAQRHRKLRAVVSALSEQDRQCLFLRAEGLRYREIADVLGVSLGTVSACLVRALDKLKRVDSLEGGID